MTAPKWKTTDPKVHPQVPGEAKCAVHPGDMTRHTHCCGPSTTGASKASRSMTKPDAKENALQGSVLIKVQERPAHGPQKASCLLGLPGPGGEGGGPWIDWNAGGGGDGMVFNLSKL